MTQSAPIISVVTVCRNSLAALQATAASVANQTYPHIDYVVVDGASTDGTPQWLQEHADPSIRWTSEPDGGIYDAMNKGAARAIGTWVIYMNAGDTFASTDTLSQVMAQADSSAAVVYGDVLKADRNGAITLKEAEEPRNSHRMWFCHQSSITKRQTLLAYPFDTRYRLSADIDLYKRLYLAGERFQRLHMPIAVFDTQGVSNTRRAAGLRENISIVMRHDKLIDKIRLLPRLCVPYIACRLRHK